ncbi:glycosyltransferase 87 family protein [Solwaraspora sp. WMMD406]|uniref:glycosyltransferase 87 family protein n=1 Tax=Solwaraspora sp. WMMD406 TaxID=3016095 RepID=UPI002415D323|nr:glycosyltransferase 87 family protein [Solwaraspora sp. WMMD406]MDG4763090.1 glycosyltransferase 87 family protein [Solwaraspora sp. WMMD406]
MIVRAAAVEVRQRWHQLNHSDGALTGDLWLYLLSAVFAALTAVATELPAHQAWAGVATAGYAVMTLIVLGQLLIRRYAGPPSCAPAESTGPRRRGPTRFADAVTGTGARAWSTAVAWALTVGVPLTLQATQRAAGHTERAQEEVLVVEDGGARLLADGSPYLSKEEIAAIPADERLLGYLPYQPGMAIFGIPRALTTPDWWTDARIWFALGTLVTLAAAGALVRRRTGTVGPALIRAVQLTVVLPLGALALSTGGDDLPVLTLALLALVLCAAGRYGTAGTAIGTAAALKIIAWPVLAVLLVHAATRGRRALVRLATGALIIPVAVVLPAALTDGAALLHNVAGFPFGAGLVPTPAASPLPGQLIADWLPYGRAVATVLLLLAGAVIAVRVLRDPPGTAAAAALVCGYGLLVAILLMPSTRFGYLLYPVALLSWVPVLRTVQVPR